MPNPRRIVEPLPEAKTSISAGPMTDTASTDKPPRLGVGTAAFKNVDNMGNVTVDHLTISDGKNIVGSTGSGTKIGTAAGQKFGLWGVTPVIQPSGADQAAVTLGSSNDAIGSLTFSSTYDAAEVQALRDATELLQDDVRSIHGLLAALRTAGVNGGVWKGSS